jgi:hypothetical protein
MNHVKHCLLSFNISIAFFWMVAWRRNVLLVNMEQFYDRACGQAKSSPSKPPGSSLLASLVYFPDNCLSCGHTQTLPIHPFLHITHWPTILID